MKLRALMLAALLALVAPFAPAQDKVLQRLSGANGWLNSAPLGADQLRGKVVLVNFGTYTCINWLRTLPYVRAWAEKYGKHGLVLVSAHTPEFEFEKDVDKVRRVLRDMNVGWPVAIDNDYAIWNAFRNNAWPAVYLIDATGRVRYRHLGEEQYEHTEKMIQQLLAEAGKPPGRELVMPARRGAEAAPDWANVRSPETYLGSARAQNGVNRPAARLQLNQWSAAGAWTTMSDSLRLQAANGRIAFRFHARDLHLVMGPASGGKPVRFRVRIDGQAPAGAGGGDVDAQGAGTASEQRMYQLIRQPQPVVERTFEIEFLDPGVEAYAFTFG